jgi:ribosomal-protein-alanine N-acetyltransferase
MRKFIAAQPGGFFMFPQLQTKRLLLKQFQAEDQDFVFEALSHPEVIQHYGVNYSSLEGTKVQMEWFNQLFTEKTGIWWKIVDSATGERLGGIGMNNYQLQHHKTEIGYWLLPKHWGKGIVSEALSVMIEYLFSEWNIHRIEAVVEEGNHNSSRVLEKAGFRYEGTMRDCEIKNGKYISLLMFSLLSSDKQQS